MSRWNEHNFEGLGYPPGRRRAQKSGGSFFVGLLVLLVAAVGAVMWYLNGRGVRVASDMGAPLIQADRTPFKAKPTQPGGLEVPHQEILVYERLDPEFAPSVVERLLPPPEAPLPKPVAAPNPPAQPPQSSTAASSPSTPVGPGPSQQQGQSSSMASSMASTTMPTVSSPPVLPIGLSGSSIAVGALIGRQPALDVGNNNMTNNNMANNVVATPLAGAPGNSPPPNVLAPQAPPLVPPSRQNASPLTVAPPTARPPAPLSVSTNPPRPPATSTPPSGGGGSYRIQIASVKSEAEAQAEWKRLAHRYPDVLSSLSLSVARADLGDRGVYYRVQSGMLDETRAKNICQTLKTQNVGCQLVRH
ncbi:putative SPOR domain-containing protein [Azospirillaceae bacterium]